MRYLVLFARTRCFEVKEVISPSAVSSPRIAFSFYHVDLWAIHCVNIQERRIVRVDSGTIPDSSSYNLS